MCFRIPASRRAALSLALVVAAIAITWAGCSQRSDRVTAPVETGQAVVSGVLDLENPRVEPVRVTQEAHTAELLSRDGVVGTGIGADDAGNPVVLILTRRAGVPALPATLDGIPTRVDVVGDVEAMAYTGYYRPVPCGVSVGNDRECAAGTIGCMVNRGGTRYMLSNNHVFARVNAASIGERIDQPGRYDRGCGSSYQVGSLYSFVPISFSGTNYIDAALASLSTTSTCSMVNSLYTPSSTTQSPSVGLAVKKVGRTSGLTHGTISGINVTIQVSYGSGRVATFAGQIYVHSSFILSGDSGSLMVTESGNRPVGLCFAGGSGSSFANTITRVLSAFSATVCGG